MRNTIIYLIGFPGTGKYTVAQAIAAQENFRIVDNHLINNVLFSLIHVDGVTRLPFGIWRNVRKIWDAVLDTLIHIAPPEYNFILTNALFESNAGDRAWFNQIAQMAATRQAFFVPVRLLCAVDEHERRIVTPERRARLKETDPTSPARYAQEDEVLHIDHPHALTLDITRLSPGETAWRILKHVGDLSMRPPEQNSPAMP